MVPAQIKKRTHPEPPSSWLRGRSKDARQVTMDVTISSVVREFTVFYP